MGEDAVWSCGGGGGGAGASPRPVGEGEIDAVGFAEVFVYRGRSIERYVDALPELVGRFGKSTLLYGFADYTGSGVSRSEE